MCFLCGLCYFIFFLLPDSGGCARKRAAMSVTLTSVKRVQSSPNLLAAGITPLTHRVILKWLHLPPSFQSHPGGMGTDSLNAFQIPNYFFLIPRIASILSGFVLKIKKPKETDTLLKTSVTCQKC